MKQTKKHRKLVLDTEKLKPLDSGRLAAVVGGMVPPSVLCWPSTNN
jgi:hypothetical protein